MNAKRLRTECVELAPDSNGQVSVAPCECRSGCTPLSHWVGTIFGPEGSPYEGGVFLIDVSVPETYPFRPPKMYFRTKVWHPNVSGQNGAIALEALKGRWNPTLTLTAILISVQSLLANPDLNDPQDHEVISMLKRNPEEFSAKAREWTKRFAK